MRIPHREKGNVRVSPPPASPHRPSPYSLGTDNGLRLNVSLYSPFHPSPMRFSYVVLAAQYVLIRVFVLGAIINFCVFLHVCHNPQLRSMVIRRVLLSIWYRVERVSLGWLIFGRFLALWFLSLFPPYVAPLYKSGLCVRTFCRAECVGSIAIVFVDRRTTREDVVKHGDPGRAQEAGERNTHTHIWAHNLSLLSPGTSWCSCILCNRFGREYTFAQHDVPSCNCSTVWRSDITPAIRYLFSLRK